MAESTKSLGVKYHIPKPVGYLDLMMCVNGVSRAHVCWDELHCPTEQGLWFLSSYQTLLRCSGPGNLAAMSGLALSSGRASKNVPGSVSRSHPIPGLRSHSAQFGLLKR